MRSLLFLLCLSTFTVLASPVLLTFEPPKERTDNSPLADSEITHYKWDAYGANSTIKDTIFPNTGNMTEVTIDVPKDRYLICLYAKATYWSALRCTYVNMFEPKPPITC